MTSYPGGILAALGQFLCRPIALGDGPTVGGPGQSAPVDAPKKDWQEVGDKLAKEGVKQLLMGDKAYKVPDDMLKFKTDLQSKMSEVGNTGYAGTVMKRLPNIAANGTGYVNGSDNKVAFMIKKSTQ